MQKNWHISYFLFNWLELLSHESQIRLGFLKVCLVSISRGKRKIISMTVMITNPFAQLLLILVLNFLITMILFYFNQLTGCPNSLICQIIWHNVTRTKQETTWKNATNVYWAILQKLFTNKEWTYSITTISKKNKCWSTCH